MRFLVKSRVNEQYREQQENRYQELYYKTKELRGFRHDYRHHVNYMNQICATGDWESLQEYVQSLGKMQRRVSMVFTGNSVVDAVVSYFRMQMEEKGIGIQNIKAIVDRYHGMITWDLEGIPCI